MTYRLHCAACRKLVSLAGNVRARPDGSVHTPCPTCDRDMLGWVKCDVCDDRKRAGTNPRWRAYSASRTGPVLHACDRDRCRAEADRVRRGQEVLL